MKYYLNIDKTILIFTANLTPSKSAWRTVHILPMVSTMGLNGAIGIGMAIGNTIPTTLPLVFYYEIR